MLSVIRVALVMMSLHSDRTEPETPDAASGPFAIWLCVELLNLLTTFASDWLVPKFFSVP